MNMDMFEFLESVRLLFAVAFMWMLIVIGENGCYGDDE